MRIDKLDIKGFGKFNNFEVEFDRGLNIVFGENESGKSTMQAFIKAMFYSLKRGRNSKQEVYAPLKKYKPWGGGEYKGSLRYTLDNGETFIVERNFQKGETKIYDFLYKDITKTFDQSKDKGPLFATKHIGLSEACFEKTLFVGQMATRIDNRNKNEILDSLANISETGSEDISFITASEAIKDALKRHVGTDKTSTRPLDIINSKLAQLNAKKQNLLEVKESLLTMEEEVAVLNNKKSRLEELKTVIKFAKDIIKIREELDVYKKRKKDINDIIYEITALNKEFDNLKESIKEYQNTKELFERSSDFGFDEVDDLYIKYTKYENLKDENTRIIAEINNIKRSADETKALIESLKAFEIHQDLNIDYSTLGNEFNIESVNKAEIQTKISALKFKNRVFVSIMAAISLLIVAILLYSVLNKNYYYIIGNIVFLAIFFIIAVFKSRNNKLLNSLMDKEYQLDKKLNSLLEKREKQKLIQEEMFKMLEVSSIDEFLKKKVLYDNKIYELNSQKKRIAELEDELEKNCNIINEILQFIKEKLMVFQIINSTEVEVNIEHIEAFRNIINKYKETTAYLSSVEDRLKDLGKQIEKLYLRAYSICGQKVNDIRELNKISNEIEEKIEN